MDRLELKIKLIFLLAVLPFPCLMQSCGNLNQNPTNIQNMANGALNFSLNIYQQLVESVNEFISPFSIRTALAMAAVGALGTTLTQMDNALQLNNFPNQAAINQGFLSVLSSICSNANYTLKTANRIYLDSSFNVSQNFLTTLNQSYLADAVQVNFQTNASAETTEINSWVSQQTDNKINNLFAPGSLNSQTKFVIVNAIYFKGFWEQQFNSNLTNNETFTLSNGQTVTTPIMNIKSWFNYTVSNTLNSQVLELNYAGDNLVMYVILPTSPDTLTSLQSKLTPQAINSFRQSFNSTQLIVKFPKFSLNFKKELNNNLTNLGMVNAFSPTSADFGGISNSSQLFIGTVIHQAFVSVDETGTTAAAATGIGGITAVVGPAIPTFNATRPFLFLIYHTGIDQILFIGNLNNPNP